MQATLYTTTSSKFHILNIKKPSNCKNTKNNRVKHKKKTVTQQKPKHNEDQNGTKKEQSKHSISEIKIRKLNVNRLGDQNKRDKTLKRTKQDKR